MARLKYLNVREMRQEFLARVQSHRLFVHDEGLKILGVFLDEFDVSRVYPEQWWIDKLGCRNEVRSSVPIDMMMSMMRQQLQNLFSEFLCYTIPTTEAFNQIKQFVGNSELHEHMAGSGYWAYLLQQHGVKVKAFSKPDGIYNVARAKKFTYIEYGDVTRARLPCDVALMLSWVPHGSNAPLPLLEKMRTGQKMVYIGDWGCCGDYQLHDYIELRFREVGEYNPPRLMEIKDHVGFYEKQ